MHAFSTSVPVTGLSKLSYVPVCVQAVTGTCRALHDGGSKINLINGDRVAYAVTGSTDYGTNWHQRHCRSCSADRCGVARD